MIDQQKWAHHFLTLEDFKLVEEAIAAVEKNTSGEIVPVIVKNSASPALVAELLTAILIVVGFVIGLGVSHFAISSNATQSLDHSNLMSTLLTTKTGAILFVLVFVAILIAAQLLAKTFFIQRLFIPTFVQKTYVHQRAFAEFCLQRIDRTENRSGILIFISLMERQVVVLADKGISEKLPEETWNEVVQLIIEKIKIGKPAEGLIAGIRRCGDILQKHFPANGSEKNELSNGLIVKL